MRQVALPAEAKPSPRRPEQALLDYVDRLPRQRDGLIALHVRLAQLQPHNRRDHHLRAAFSCICGACEPKAGELFHLRDGNIVFIGRTEAKPRLQEAIDRLRQMFCDDPVMEVKPNHPGSFHSWFDLGRDLAAFGSVVREAARVLDKLSVNGWGCWSKPAIQPGELARLERTLDGTDIRSLVRSQAICAVMPDDTTEQVFDERFVSIAQLERSLCPEGDMAANRWLFQHLTETLDRRMLAYLAGEIGHADRPLSVNLNVSTLLSTDFQHFHDLVSHVQRFPIVIELQIMDVFADLGAYLFARDLVRERGYRICLDGLNHLMFEHLGRDKLGVDLVKLVWGSEMASLSKPEAIKGLRDKLVETGLTRIILCRCDTAQSIEIGRNVGVGLFQGRHIDRLPAARSSATAA